MRLRVARTAKHRIAGKLNGVAAGVFGRPAQNTALPTVQNGEQRSDAMDFNHSSPPTSSTHKDQVNLLSHLNLQLAQALLARAVDKVHQQFGKPVCISVCDSHGFLVGFFRMDNAPVRSIQLAHQKAYTSTRMGVTTEAFHARLRREEIPISYFCDPLLTALPGGALLSDAQGSVIGAIGISGLTPAEDQAVADELARFGTPCRLQGDAP
ncbi:heme-binding protein [Paraburkholderia madseniana]|uniref:GlcG/HbpS family heme-binding protein n=1 Tax=Paraburkholderia madseniana TaxID=2599607 RepID=UPI0038B933EB